MRKILVAILAIAATAQAHEQPVTPDIDIRGALTSGTLLIGDVHSAERVELNGEPLRMTPEGQVVFGFGRDQHGAQELTLFDHHGRKFKKTLQIKPRQYKIDRVDGVPQQTVTPDPEQQQRAKREAAQVWTARNNALSDRTDFLAQVKMPAQGRISGVYGSQRIFNGTPRNPHFGLDIAAPTGSPVLAPWSGKVILAENDLFYSGGTLIIDHGYGVTSTYIHLHKLHAAVGDEVAQGQKIAEIGATGRVTGPHLDWRINWRHERLDPALVIEHFSATATSPVPAADR
ncbi:M23 family metallopeptidase [Pseudidiomarina gelatinasegens]|uniref:M23 family metallopeptidase n=1 Tax=Pseudidiomarina gelatinasegens TaxID=2487740 RepID=A0A443Z5V6_9GAMM|nr:M23 family metallopeptidase [Pseudidiomarina gelatinasegens]RWU12147.1 M23 family metallopeptidase [Pseudidiomarina gelatinasegens]